MYSHIMTNLHNIERAKKENLESKSTSKIKAGRHYLQNDTRIHAKVIIIIWPRFY